MVDLFKTYKLPGVGERAVKWIRETYKVDITIIKDWSIYQEPDLSYETFASFPTIRYRFRISKATFAPCTMRVFLTNKSSHLQDLYEYEFVWFVKEYSNRAVKTEAQEKWLPDYLVTYVLNYLSDGDVVEIILPITKLSRTRRVFTHPAFYNDAGRDVVLPSSVAQQRHVLEVDKRKSHILVPFESQSEIDSTMHVCIFRSNAPIPVFEGSVRALWNVRANGGHDKFVVVPLHPHAMPFEKLTWTSTLGEV